MPDAGGGSEVLKPPNLPFWQVNVPVASRTTECPEALRGLSAKDQEILSTPDAAYKRQSWEEVRRFVRANRLDLFKRVPSDLRRYRFFVYDIEHRYGSVKEFVLAEKLGWKEPFAPRGAPFEFEEDYKVLVNDWPYGLDERIVHLVVWTKFELEVAQDGVGDITPKAKRQIESFVRGKFMGAMRHDEIVWFRNWTSLKSVHAIEHFHVMLFDPPPELVRKATGAELAMKLRS